MRAQVVGWVERPVICFFVSVEEPVAGDSLSRSSWQLDSWRACARCCIRKHRQRKKVCHHATDFFNKEFPCVDFSYVKCSGAKSLDYKNHDKPEYILGILQVINGLMLVFLTQELHTQLHCKLFKTQSRYMLVYQQKPTPNLKIH